MSDDYETGLYVGRANARKEFSLELQAAHDLWKQKGYKDAFLKGVRAAIMLAEGKTEAEVASARAKAEL